MHVKSRLMAFGGLALALCILFMVLGSIFETGTLFFLAASSFFVGIVIRESGMKMGLAFYLAAVLLGFILAPNKFYVITFGAMGLYILVIEGVWRLLAKNPGRLRGRGLFSVSSGPIPRPCGRPRGGAGRTVDLRQRLRIYPGPHLEQDAGQAAPAGRVNVYKFLCLYRYYHYLQQEG